ncbi:ABC transporter permease [Paracoccus saliphilus]|uniref:ABC transporter permease n=1 Tax=Paracoccus saliphilus TaxID=405559 RepID=A0AA46A4U7_9RHOB|nr:ABC transporter permease [Paracoccus saliphilus]WCR01408.1 ABC transporter permease [Paracoccus saliphilus]SIS69871.1 putative spermidine/putrescine transport system permease protein [Paracoccus saliphilus]
MTLTVLPESPMPQAKKAESNRRMAMIRRKLGAVLPAVPLIVFLAMFLVVPLAIIIKTAIQDREIVAALPATVEHLATSGSDDQAFALLVDDLIIAKKSGLLRPLARRMEYGVEGGSTAVMDVARIAGDDLIAKQPGQIRQAVIESNSAWGESGVWNAINAGSRSYSLFYLKWALGLDVKHRADGQFTSEISYNFPAIYLRTIVISVAVTALTVLIGYPMAYVVSTSSGFVGKILIFLVLLPFWTSLLVRTMSWIVVLQRNGVMNDLLMTSGLISEPAPLLYTRFATVLAMVQIQLPFTVLPMISVMRVIPPSHVRAARSMGASPLAAHFSVFMPQAVPGIAAGALLTFVLCLGFYLTPALVGGPGDQMVSFFIARFTNEQLNWGLASALSLVLIGGATVIALPLSRYISTHSSGRF